MVQLPADKLLEKAQKFVESRRIEFLGNGVYNVVGDHGTYAVAQDFSGKLSCNCLGFLRKGRCSHAIAVALLREGRLRIPNNSRRS